jgi:ABC-type branched-subunit amino acid transport system permease subunit
MIVLLATVIGGIGMQWGPLVGTIIVVFLEFQLARYAGYSLLIQGIILLIIMLVAPKGILGFIRDQRMNGGLRARLRLSTQRAGSAPKAGED